MVILENIIREELSKTFLLCEIKIAIDDLKKRGFATQIGQMYADALKAYHPIKITGKIGAMGEEYQSIINKLGIRALTNEGYDGSYFAITLQNGDVIEVFRNTNPAYAMIFLNGSQITTVKNSNELFRQSMPVIVAKYYSEHLLANTEVENK